MQEKYYMLEEVLTEPAGRLWISNQSIEPDLNILGMFFGSLDFQADEI